jgi:hypothetical protein
MISQYKVEYADGMTVYATVTQGAKKGLLVWFEDGKPMTGIEPKEFWPLGGTKNAEEFLKANLCNHDGSKWGPVVGLPGKR